MAMERIELLVSEGNIDELIRICIDMQLEAAGQSEADVNGVPAYVVSEVLIFAYLLKGSLYDAKFVWKRTPQEAKQSSAELVAAWQVARCFIQRQPPVEAITSFTWTTSVVGMLAQQLLEKYVNDVFEYVATAYSRVSLQQLSTLTGLGEDKCLKRAVEEHQWKHDQASGTLEPASQKDDSRDRDRPTAAVATLVQRMVELES